MMVFVLLLFQDIDLWGIDFTLVLTELAYFGSWQPGCAEYFPTKDLAGAQLVQIKVLCLLYILSVN